MTLKSEPSKLGLWRNPDWNDGEPGTFAVVIGVSQYLHLHGGPNPAVGRDPWIVEARQLGQLRVSALTAYKFFEWLAKEYRCDGAPIAECWLLLSPTEDELQCAPSMASHQGLPTLESCKQALRDWRASIRRLPEESRHRTRAIFFFSGHGLQSTHEHQIFIPCDYLEGEEPNWNDAISTYNLRYGLESMDIPHRFYFIDACRNDFPKMRGKGIRGRDDILPAGDAADVYPGIRAAAVLYATSSALQAWQPKDVTGAMSLFGQALLDGLRGVPDVELKAEDGLVSIGFSKLEAFVAEKVLQLIKAANSSVQQPVQPSGIVRDEPVTYMSRAYLATVRSQLTADERTRSLGATRGERVAQTLDSVYTEARIGPSEGLLRKDRKLAHELFGSEYVGDLFMSSLRLFALGSGRWCADDQIRFCTTERDEAARQYRVEVEVDSHERLGYWLEVSDTGGRTRGCVLSRDPPLWGPMRYVLELDIDYGPDGCHGGEIARLEAYLSKSNPGPLGEAASIWHRYRTADIADAVNALTAPELKILEGIMYGKLDSPLAATVAGLVLIRAGRLDLLHDMLRYVSNWYSEFPDGSALWAEQVMRQQEDRVRAIRMAAESLGPYARRPLPFTSEGLSYAATLTERLMPVADRLYSDVRDWLERAHTRIQSSLAYFQPGGLFASYSGFTCHQDHPPTEIAMLPGDPV